jgi:hypothetical protein
MDKTNNTYVMQKLLFETVDDGNEMNIDFDETIIFAHSYSYKRIYEPNGYSLRNEPFPYLISQEFNLGNPMISLDMNNLLAFHDKELMNLVYSRTKNFLSTSDVQFK